MSGILKVECCCVISVHIAAKKKSGKLATVIEDK